MSKNIIFILTLFANYLFSQSILTGVVVDNFNNLPLENANIVLVGNGSEFGSSSNANGNFEIISVPYGNYDLVVTFIGFKQYKKNLEINQPALDFKIILKMQPIEMSELEILSDSEIEKESFPGASSVMDKQRIKLVNPIGTQEILEYLPGINGFSDDGIGNSRISISIRGLNPRRSSRVLILEDGIPIQPALYVYPNMYYNPPADRIDQIEVIKGSGTILHGPQTMGGVINYFTKKPRNQFGGILKLTAGENGYSSLFTEIGGWGDGKVRPEIQLLLKRGDGFRENNAFEQANATLKLNYKKSASKNLYFKANFNYEDSQATYTGLTKWSFENNPKFNPKKDDNFKVFRTAFDLIQSEKINSNTSKSTTAFFSFFDRRWWRENDIFVDVNDIYIDGKYIPNPDAEARNHWSFLDLARVGNGKDNFGILRTFYVGGLKQSYKVDYNLLDNYKSDLEFGWRAYWEKFIDDRKTGITSDSTYSPSAREGVYYRGVGDSLEILGTSHHYETTALSLYASNSINLGRFMLRPGLRIEVFEQERVDRLSGGAYQDNTLIVPLPGIGFSGTLFGSTIFGGIHRGFTPPSSGALKILNFGEGLEDSGLDLEAEKSWNKELGIRGSVSLVNYEITGFHIGIENLVAAGRGTAFKNLGKVNSFGVETSLDFHLSKFSTILPNVGITYTYLSTRVKDGIITSNIQPVNQEISIEGKQLPYSPNHTLNIGTEFRIIPGYLFRIDYKYVSECYTDFQNIKDQDDLGIMGPIDAYGIINISGSIKLNDNIKLFLSGKNIEDKSYIGSRLHSNPGQKDANISSGILPGARKQVNIGVNYSF